MTRPARLAIVASHPIQYYAPYYRALAGRSGLDVRAFFASRIGVEGLLDPDMGVAVAWSTDLLGGYSHEFLPRADRVTRTGFAEVNNPRVGAALARYRPDVVLLHGYAQMTMLKALAWCGSRGVPAMMISDSALHSGTSRARRAVKAALLPGLLRRFGAFLTIGDSNERFLAFYGAPRSRFFRVPNMVAEEFWACRGRRAAERQAARAALGLEESDFAVLFVGKLIPRKRPGNLIAALRHLSARQTSRRVRVLFAGDGVLRPDLERAAGAALPAEFLGFVNMDRLPALYCAADALAHPAGIETFGMIVLEAAVLGLPLVLSDRVGAIGPTSIARPGENALVYPCGDTEALAGHLARLAREPETCRRLSEASLRISTHHDGTASVAATLAAVTHCAGNVGIAAGRDQLTTVRSVTRRQFVPSENASTAPPLSSDT